MRAVNAALALAGVLFAAACLPVTSKAPLGTTVKPAAEAALIGTWKGHVADNRETSYWHFLPAKEGAMTVLGVTAAKNNAGWGEYMATATMLGTYRYLNVRSVSSDGKPAGKEEAARNIPVLYKMRGGKLTLYLIGEKAAKDAIAKGQIEGEIEKGDYGDATITATPEKLDTFFASPEGAKLFTEKIATLKKVE